MNARDCSSLHCCWARGWLGSNLSKMKEVVKVQKFPPQNFSINIKRIKGKSKARNCKVNKWHFLITAGKCKGIVRRPGVDGFNEKKIKYVFCTIFLYFSKWKNSIWKQNIRINSIYPISREISVFDLAFHLDVLCRMNVAELVTGEESWVVVRLVSWSIQWKKRF